MVSTRSPAKNCRSCLQTIIGEIRKHVGIDRIVAKRLSKLLQTDPAEPTVDVQVQSFRPLSVVVCEEIDTSAAAVPAAREELIGHLVSLRRPH